MSAGGSGLTGRRVPVTVPSGGDRSEDEVRHSWRRYVALGDSFTEGVGDPEPGNPDKLRGWADRAAEELAVGHDDFSYANLAVRGRLLEQILDQQIGPALALKPDLITLSAGGNDMVFHGTDPDKLANKLEAGVDLLSQTGATLVLFTGPDWGSTPILGRNRAKVAVFNENVHAIAAGHDAVIADLWALRQLKDPRMWYPDRLHLSPLGHHTVAMMVLDTLNVQHTLHPTEPKDLAETSWRQARTSDLLWARNYLAPWAVGKLRHHATNKDPRAKRPDATPITSTRDPADPFPALAEG